MLFQALIYSHTSHHGLQNIGWRPSFTPMFSDKICTIKPFLNRRTKNWTVPPPPLSVLYVYAHTCLWVYFHALLLPNLFLWDRISQWTWSYTGREQASAIILSLHSHTHTHNTRVIGTRDHTQVLYVQVLRILTQVLMLEKQMFLTTELPPQHRSCSIFLEFSV